MGLQQAVEPQSEPTNTQQLLQAELAAAHKQVATLEREKAEAKHKAEENVRAAEELQQALHAEQQRSAQHTIEVSTAGDTSGALHHLSAV